MGNINIKDAIFDGGFFVHTFIINNHNTPDALFLITICALIHDGIKFISVAEIGIPIIFINLSDQRGVLENLTLEKPMASKLGKVPREKSPIINPPCKALPDKIATP